MKIENPKAPANNPELVRAPDPQRPATCYAVWPGAQLVAESPGRFDWAALLVNEPIEQYEEGR